MITINVADLPVFTAEKAEYETGIDASDFAQPGVYRVLIGSRCETEECEYLGNVDTFVIPTLEEVISFERDMFETDDEATEYFEEFYGHGLEDRGYEFGYTEEGYDLYIRVG